MMWSKDWWDKTTAAVQPGDTVFFSFSGHGAREKEHFPGSERAIVQQEIGENWELFYTNDLDEVFVLPAYDNSGKYSRERLVDNELMGWFKAVTDKGAKVIAVLDACFGSTLQPEDDSLRGTEVSARLSTHDGAAFANRLFYAVPFDDEEKLVPYLVIDGRAHGALSYLMAKVLAGSATDNSGNMVTSAKSAGFYLSAQSLVLSNGSQKALLAGVNQQNKDVILLPSSNQPEPTVPTDVLKPTLYVLAIGVSDYDDDYLDLNYPAKDASDFAAAMAKQKGLYRDVQVKLLTNPNDIAILNGLDWLSQQVTNRDVAMLFFAGHGSKDKYGNYQLLASNSNPDRLDRTAVPAQKVKDVLSYLPSKRIAFLDACHSGDIWGGNTRGLGSMINMDDVANELAAVENGIIVFSSSTGKQLSQENAAWQNGAFTRALLEGLAGKADYKGERKITYTFLNAYIADRVKELTGNAQTPTLVVPKSMPDFPIAVVK